MLLIKNIRIHYNSFLLKGTGFSAHAVYIENDSGTPEFPLRADKVFDGRQIRAFQLNNNAVFIPYFLDYIDEGPDDGRITAAFRMPVLQQKSQRVACIP